MGYLADQGITYDYYESLAFQNLLKQKGINQFLMLLEKFGNFNVHDHDFDHLKDPSSLHGDPSLKLLWGDEFEGHVIRMYPDQKLALLQPNTGAIFEQLLREPEQPFIALPEFGAWMIELTPNKPYQCMCYNFDQVLINMRIRVRTLEKHLPEGNRYLLVPVYPMLGVGRFTTHLENNLDVLLINKIKSQASYIEKTPTLLQSEKNIQYDFMVQPATPFKELPPEPICNYFSQSVYFDDRIINPHPRYSTLAQNIRLRRGSKVEIKIPIFKDVNTSYEQSEYEPNPGFITMDHMGFGMGNCALQTTYLSIDIDHARLLYDQLSILAPLFAALTAGSSVFKGKLADWDTKWDCLEMSVDCRNENERNSQHQSYIPKSRYSSISYYISNDQMNLPEYNDVKLPVNQQIIDYAKKKSEAMGLQLDDRLLTHLGALFIRDNMVMFKDSIHTDDNITTSHFEAIQSTNWNSVRFKPPPSYQSKIGWRVEFRTMEIQLTPEENAAWSIYVLMIVRLFYKKLIKVNFYIPMSYVDENMKRSREKDAIINQKFYFRTNIQDDGPPIIKEMYLKEILFGSENFKGIQGLLDESRSIMIKDPCAKLQEELMMKNRKLQDEVVAFVKSKVNGECKTLARWIREFMMNHPDYKSNSIITHNMNYDLITKLIDIKDRKLEDQHFPKIFSI